MRVSMPIEAKRAFPFPTSAHGVTILVSPVWAKTKTKPASPSNASTHGARFVAKPDASVVCWATSAKVSRFSTLMSIYIALDSLDLSRVHVMSASCPLYGPCRTQQRIREIYWWLKMDSWIEEAMKRCGVCDRMDKS